MSLLNHKKLFKIKKRYLNYPVKNGEKKCFIHLIQEENVFREFDIELTNGKEDFWVYTDMKEFIGKTIEIKIFETEKDSLLERIKQTDHFIGSENLYQEKYRPQLHYTSKRGWLNDPNGLSYHKGKYHMFYQHNPYGYKWGNMHWGHATSSDLVHWKEYGDKLVPDTLGTMFSGSAITHKNKHFLFYTAAGGSNRLSKGKKFTQCMAISEDGGKTYQKFDKNPIINHLIAGNRDPKVIWHDQKQCWIMAIYLKDIYYALYSSKDLENWEMIKIYSIEGCSECPDFFRLPLDGNMANQKWVFSGANSNYFLADFDGADIKKVQNEKKSQLTTTTYAAQTFDADPEGRIIQVSWGRFDFSNMPFNMFLTIPSELSLKTYNNEICLCTNPVKELETLYKDKALYYDLKVKDAFSYDTKGNELFDILLECENKDFILSIKGEKIKYCSSKNQITFNEKELKVDIEEQTFDIRVISDNTIIEVFINGGRYYFVEGNLFENNDHKIKINGDLLVRKLEINELCSIWDK